jgi:hypothetical protein
LPIAHSSASGTRGGREGFTRRGGRSRLLPSGPVMLPEPCRTTLQARRQLTWAVTGRGLPSLMVVRVLWRPAPSGWALPAGAGEPAATRMLPRHAAGPQAPSVHAARAAAGLTYRRPAARQRHQLALAAELRNLAGEVEAR